MKAFIQINNPSRAHAWLLGFALTRAVLDYFWIPGYQFVQIWILVWFNYTVYIYTLYLLIPAIAIFTLEKLFSMPVDEQAVLRGSILVWVVYPAVAVISLITKSPPIQTIEWFRYIPTFMVYKNFMPTGFIAAIPVLLVFYVRLLVRHSRVNWFRAIASVLVPLFVIYLLYYQYLLRLFYFVDLLYGPFFSFGYLTFCFLIPLLPLAKRFHSAFGSQRIMLHRLVLISTIISLTLMGFGFSTALLPGEDGQVALSDPASILPDTRFHWKLRFFQLYDQAGALTDYGFYLDKNGAGGPIRRIKLYHQAFNSYLLFNDLKQAISDTDRLAYGDLVDVRIQAKDLIFDWNRPGSGGDRYLETFQGTITITKCAATVAGEKHSCFILEEDLSSDAARLKSWAGATFLAADADALQIIAFAYDKYSDGIIAWGDDQRRVTSVSRQGLEIHIEFEGGMVSASCNPFAHYQINELAYGAVPIPVNSPVRCDLSLKFASNSQSIPGAVGMLKWIGEDQGKRK